MSILDYSKYYKYVSNKTYRFYSDSIGMDNKKVIFDIEFYETSSFKRMYIKDGNTVIYKVNDIAKEFNTSIKNIKDIFKKDSFFRKGAFVYDNKIIVNNGYKYDFLKLISENFNYDITKLRFDITEVGYYKLFIYVNGVRVYLNQVFDEIEYDYIDYVNEIFTNNKIDVPNLIYIMLDYAFEKEEDAFNFLTLANKNLFDKIKMYFILSKLK